MASRAQPPTPEPSLRLPVDEAAEAIGGRIQVGVEIADLPARTLDDLSELRQRYYTWSEYNTEWLRRHIGPKIADEYSATVPMFVVTRTTFQQDVSEFRDDVRSKVRRLTSIKERLPLWVPAEASTGATTAVVPLAGPVFVVHGSDVGRAYEVARMLDRATARDAVILHEQANAGATILEKFERHAATASFAVVVLTADDEGRRRGTDSELQPRGRQNVIMELGVFFGLLGRGRVAVLLDPSVERPSDIHGLVYIQLDAAGAWKQALARELEAAGIPVNRARMP